MSNQDTILERLDNSRKNLNPFYSDPFVRTDNFIRQPSGRRWGKFNSDSALHPEELSGIDRNLSKVFYGTQTSELQH